jgi:hypothetical protein
VAQRARLAISAATAALSTSSLTTPRYRSDGSGIPELTPI